MRVSWLGHSPIYFESGQIQGQLIKVVDSNRPIIDHGKNRVGRPNHHTTHIEISLMPSVWSLSSLSGHSYQQKVTSFYNGKGIYKATNRSVGHLFLSCPYGIDDWKDNLSPIIHNQ